MAYEFVGLVDETSYETHFYDDQNSRGHRQYSLPKLTGYNILDHFDCPDNPSKRGHDVLVMCADMVGGHGRYFAGCSLKA